MLYKLVSLMDRARFKNKVISMTDIGPMGDKIISEGIPVLSLGMTQGKPTLTGLLELIKILRKAKIDVLQTWLYHADLLGFLAGKLTGNKKIVWGLRCSDMDLKNYRILTTLTVRVNALLSPYVNHIISNSLRGMLFHKNIGYDHRKMIIIRNGLLTDKFRPDNTAKSWLAGHLNISEENFLVGLIARYDPMKDHENFLRASSLVAAKQDRVHFILAGKDVDNNNRFLVDLINLYGLGDRVHLMGLRHDISRITAGLDVAVSSSAYGEGFSNSLGEAMSCGIPCVATDVGDSAEILNKTGIIVPPRNPDSLAQAVNQLLSMDKGKRVELGERARRQIIDHYDIKKIVREFENFYEELVGN